MCHNLHILSYSRPARLDSFRTDITYHEVDLSTYPLFEYPPYDLAIANMMVNLIQFEKLDILHVDYAIPHATSAYLAKQILIKAASNIPVITSIHGTAISLIECDPTYT